MAYQPYATYDDYLLLGLDEFGDEQEITNALRTASRHIDTLTFNRIIGAGGLQNLTEFQQEIIKEVACKQALFEWENRDALDSMLTGYTINGVTARFGDGVGVKQQDGVTMASSLYSFLEQTGLCCRLARYIWRPIHN